MDSIQFLQELKLIEALKFGDFTLASGKSSKFYLDLRYLPVFPNFYKSIISQLHKLISKLDFDIIIGIPLAGVPIAAALSWVAVKPNHILRKTAKKHGLGKLIEGPSIAGKTVILIDDLISSGFSKEYAIQAIRDEGGEVKDLIVLVDRREDTKPSIKWEKHWNVKVHSLFRLSPADILSQK